MNKKLPAQPEDSSEPSAEREIGEITRFLQEWKKQGNQAEQDENNPLARIIPRVVEDLRKIAHHQYRLTAASGADRPTELIGKVWEKLSQLENIPSFENSKQFYAYCATVIKHLLLDGIRRQNAHMRKGNVIPLDDLLDISILRDDNSVSQEDQVLILELLGKMEREMKEPYEVFLHKKILGFKDQETAKILDIGVSTVQLRYSLAMAWLYKELNTTL
jgi:RNA polymerase sigma factor (sigma-70 family)